MGRRRGGGRWELSEPHFLMNAVYSIAIDTRGDVPRLLVGADSSHWGPSVFTSDDLGASWQEPAEPAIRFPESTGSSLERVWQLRPAGADQPGVVYAGTEPAALFRSEDGGRSFAMIESLWNHPQRKDWGEGFGGQGMHTVLPDPRDPRKVLVAVSTGGVYRTADGGESWAPANAGIQAPYLPDPYPEFGQCVHKVAVDPVDPSLMYLQNHGGVYRSKDGGDSWQPAGEGLPATFGFPVAAHPRRGGTAYLYPLTADYRRVSPDERCRVYRTTDAGESWQPLTAGLPSEPHFGVVLRDALATDDADPAGVYFGTRNGEVYASEDEGDSWSQVAEHLPDVLCVRAAVV